MGYISPSTLTFSTPNTATAVTDTAATVFDREMEPVTGKVSIQYTRTGATAVPFNVEYSNDKVTWTVKGTAVSLAAASGMEQLDLFPARYFRFTATGNATAAATVTATLFIL